MSDVLGHPRRDRLKTWGRNLRVLSVVAVQGLEDDPVRLSLMATRRRPRRLRGPLARTLVALGAGLERPSWRALGHFLADRPDEARTVLRQVAGSSQGRLGIELAVQVAADLPEDVPPRTRARAHWQQGDVSSALRALELPRSRAARRQRSRLSSEASLLTPGCRIELPRRGTRMLPRSKEDQGSDSHERRILHLLTNSLPWTQSGYALRSHSVLRAQAAGGMAVEALTRLAYPVTVGVPWARDVDVVDGVVYRRLMASRLEPTTEGRLVLTARLLADHVERFDAHVLHTTTHYPNALVTSAAATATGRPWVYEMRGQLEKTWVASLPPHMRERAASSERFALWRARETEMAQAADHVVVLSEVMREDVVARGVLPGRVTVVPNAVDDSLLDMVHDCSPREARRRLGLPEDGFWVGTVSSIVEYEGLDILLHAVAELRAQGRDVRCALVGDGTARPALDELVTSLGLAGVSVLPGRVPRTQAALWHRALDVFVVPRRDSGVTRSVTPLKPIEAMAVGRPVVASDLPALAEIVAVPGTGLLAAPDDPSSLADRIRELADDEDLRRSLGVHGREFAASRTWRAMAGRYDSIYDSLRGAT